MKPSVLGVGLWALGAVAGGYAQDHPLPGPDAFFHRVRENLARAERATHLYTYRERRTDIHTNPFGRLGTGGTSVYEVYPSPMRQLIYRRLVQHDGQAIDAAELARQDRAYRERAAEVVRARGARHAEERALAEEEAQRARERRERALADVLDALDFRVKERAVYDGVPAIVVAFAPKPGARPTTRQGRTAQRFAGTAWIDEPSAEVMYLQATSIDDISYGLGIVARLAAGTTATVTRKPVGDGTWMPTSLTLTGRGRAVLFRRLAIDFSIEWFDYRRLPDDLLAPFLDARVHRQAGGGPQ
jgi:hypothetical protein